MMPATDDSLPLMAMGLRIRAEGQRIIFVDAVSGERLLDGEMLHAALDEQQQVLDERQRVLDEQQRVLDAERKAHQAAEAEIARLKALLVQRG